MPETAVPGNIRVIVGMSGGVDSSVSAHLLQKQGFTVEGLFMKNWEEDDGTEYCTAKEDFADARSVCDRLGIPLHTANFAAEYWDRVFEHFLHEYRAGRTPNPDILCNREIKFRAFLDYARELGADYIATGHYVCRRDEQGSTYLCKGLDKGKDQSYFLCEVTEDNLRQSLFPLGELQKTKVRKLAADLNLRTHDKKDSTGICFIGERKFKDFLETYLPAQPGAIQASNGEVLGQHTGLMFYTVGQRQGLGIGGLSHWPEAPWYVVDKDLERNVLIVAQGGENDELLSTNLIAQPPSWINEEDPELPLRCNAKIRYRQVDQTCEIHPYSGGKIRVTFNDPQRAITPGQYVVFYQRDRCLGGAIIDTCCR
ncbi:MAG: tRNA 2-thiouridine(34) synthase MnmA [Gammaproteobacteria bacterium]|nr:tRNA 2-thiouridine(34) synthase MnmA [Gammaproteobacteria bacterium]